MRLLRTALIVILILVTLLYGVTNLLSSINTSHEAPAISGSSDILEISIQDDQSALLAGITASDKQDGDLTAGILVSGISKFTDVQAATANVTYLVFDRDGNMASHTRPIRYTDYTAPRFTLTGPLNYKANESIALLDRLHANDCLDGDITGDIRVSSLQSTAAGEIYRLTAQVTNSMGHTSQLELELVRQDDHADRPEIKLSSYLVYLEKNSRFDPMAYVSHVDLGDSTVSKSMVSVSGTADTSKPGTYHIHYSYNDGSAAGLSILTVVVE